ncbi:MAG TPA: c-type cytochrome [Steroidobacteraceae bacterium]|nr:c-type cytochrome [Steroidobacteraceae bacterium]
MQTNRVRASLFGVAAIAIFGSLSVVAEAPKSQWDGVYSDAQMKRGETMYVEHCGICHGGDLLGGEMAPALIGGAFQANWNEQSLGDLFERIRISMPLTAPGSLSRAETAEILAYLLAKGGYPAGAEDLPAQVETLNSIKFIAAKP